MNELISTTKVILIALVAAVPAAARAVELGPSSRGSISISIIVPPHLQVSSSTQQPSSGPERVCFSAAGLAVSYHAELLPTHASGIKVRVKGLSIPPTALACDGDENRRQLNSIRAAQAPLGSSSGPLVLLITPD